MKFGICCGPGSFVPQEQNAAQASGQSSIARMMEVMQEAGADYVEFAVGAVTGSEDDFEKLLEGVAGDVWIERGLGGLGAKGTWFG